jgi:hypothetical protein
MALAIVCLFPSDVIFVSNIYTVHLEKVVHGDLHPVCMVVSR